jgi:hypothetical protein
MIILATVFGALVGTLAGFVMHADHRSFLGVDRHSAVVFGIMIGGITGLMGGVAVVL